MTRRLGVAQSWTPARARPLWRHLHHPTGRYVFTNESAPPSRCSVDRLLGWLRAVPLAGTTSLRTWNDGEQWAFKLGDSVELDGPGVLGFVEQAPLAELDRLGVARQRGSGQLVLIAGTDDPLTAEVHEPDWIGYIEPHPTHPRHAPHAEVSYGLLGLVRTIDRDARRHRYGLGGAAAGEPAGELGALLSEPFGDSEPVWVDTEGGIRTAEWPVIASRPAGRPALQAAVRWSADPLRWRGFGPAAPRLRATARRAFDSTRMLASRPPAPPSRAQMPSGYLLGSSLTRTSPLYAAVHPATGDQLLSTDPTEAGMLGYGRPVLLGHLAATAPVTGTLGAIHTGVPWARHFGKGAWQA